MASCKNCNSSIDKEEQYCRSCGIKIEQVEEESCDTVGEDLQATVEETPIKPENSKIKFMGPIIAVCIIIASLALVMKLEADTAGFSGANRNNNFVKSGDWIYYSLSTFNVKTSKNEYGIYKLSSDNKNKIKIYDDMAITLAVKGEWIYYSSLNDKGKIFRMTVDGQRRELISEEVSLQMVVKDNYLIYKTEDENRNLYRLDLQNGSKLKISENLISFSVVGNRIFYSSTEPLGKVYEINLDGTNKKEMFSLEGPILYANDNYLYFADTGINNAAVNNSNKYLFSNNIGKIYRINLDGSNRKSIVPVEAYNFTIYENKFYYQTINKGVLELYEMSFGENYGNKLASNMNLSGIVDGWLYYLDRGDGLYYRINLISQEKQSMN
jgi:hypothetical protein